MTVKEVSIITGLSNSYINKVRQDKTEGMSFETVNRVKFLLNLEVGYLEALFARPEFADICQLVLQKGTERLDKNIVNVIRFTNKCLRKHRTVLDSIADKPFDPDNFDYRDIMGIYMADAKAMFKNPLFCNMCSLAIRLDKSQNIRAFADLLLDIYDMLNDLDKKSILTD